MTACTTSRHAHIHIQLMYKWYVQSQLCWDILQAECTSDTQQTMSQHR